MASLSEVSIHRPVLATVMSILIVLFGGIGFSFLGVREYPNIDPPIVTVSTNYSGANADIIESQITEILEESINGIGGIREITSTSLEGRSSINVEFQLGVDMDAAANDVRDRVSRVAYLLPKDADPPTVIKADADANPILYVGIKSAKRTILETNNTAFTIIKERLQTIPGVSEVQIWGEKKYAMRLYMDALKMASLNITPLDVVAALRRENVELPSGLVEGAKVALSVRTVGRLSTADEFNNLVIRQSGQNLIRFKDIGNAQLGAQNERTLLKSDGVPMIGVVVIPQPGSNQIAIANEFHKRVAQIQKEIPADYELIKGFDNTDFIRASISEVQETIIISFLLVVVVIFLFLRDWRTTFIPVLAIPISLIGTFFIMYLAGFSINVLTLLAIVLAIGLVVDDAIVVLENIYAKIEGGMKPLKAALEGSREIYFAVISTTVVLAAVFLPIIFLQGITGRLFREFGVVVAGSVLISAFVSLSLTPMLSSKLLKNRAAQPWFYRVTEPFFEWLTESFREALMSFMKHRWLAIPTVLVFVGGIYYFIGKLPSELSPQEDRDGFRVVSTGPEGATFEYMDGYLGKIGKLLDDKVNDSEAKLVITVTSPNRVGSALNSGFVRVQLVNSAFRNRSQQQIVEDVTPLLNKIPGAKSFIVQDQSIGGGRGFNSLPLQYVIQSSTLEKLKEVLPEFLGKAQANPAFSYVDFNVRFNKPELRIEINRDRAKLSGVSIEDVAQTLQLCLAGQRFGYFLMDGRQYFVIGELGRQSRDTPLDLASIYVRNKEGKLLQLDNFIKYTESSTPPAIYRTNRAVSATLSAAMTKGVTLSQGIAELDKIAKETLNEQYSTGLAGAAREFQESSNSLLYTFLVALLLVYFILAAQFENFAAPLVIMLTVPLALTGALLSLWYFHQTLNIFSQIGIIMLIGLVTKNGILIVEFANQKREEGLTTTEAVIEAATARLRPILMTSTCTIIGILPIALALGAGSETRVSMGIGVIGGMVISTLLTLFIIPAMLPWFVGNKPLAKNDAEQELKAQESAIQHA